MPLDQTPPKRHGIEVVVRPDHDHGRTRTPIRDLRVSHPRRCVPHQCLRRCVPHQCLRRCIPHQCLRRCIPDECGAEAVRDVAEHVVEHREFGVGEATSRFAHQLSDTPAPTIAVPEDQLQLVSHAQLRHEFEIAAVSLSCPVTVRFPDAAYPGWAMEEHIETVRIGVRAVLDLDRQPEDLDRVVETTGGEAGGDHDGRVDGRQATTVVRNEGAEYVHHVLAELRAVRSRGYCVVDACPQSLRRAHISQYPPRMWD